MTNENVRHGKRGIEGGGQRGNKEDRKIGRERERERGRGREREREGGVNVNKADMTFPTLCHSFYGLVLLLFINLIFPMPRTPSPHEWSHASPFTILK